MAISNRHNVGSTAVPRGVRKINEEMIQEGRALIITESNESNYNWEDIPDGSLKVDGNTGVILVKLKGQGSWIPSNIRLDVPRDTEGRVIGDLNNSEYGHTVSIAKDAIATRENFVLLKDNVDGNKFYYEDEDGKRWIGEKSDRGYHFELHKGHYAVGRNMLDVVIDDCLYRSAASGGVIEQSETKFIITEELVEGMELTVKYFQMVRIGNPYPRFFLRRGEYTEDGIDTNGEPEAAEVGDVWIDFSGTPDDEDGYLGECLNNQNYIPWSRIVGYPRTVNDARACNLMVDVAKANHVHNFDDIIDLEARISEITRNTAHASRADYADNANNATNAIMAKTAEMLQGHKIGITPGCVVEVETSGKINRNIIPDHNHKASTLFMDDGRSLWRGVTEYVESYIKAYMDNFIRNNIDSYLANRLFTRGMIVPFFGDAIPSGWAECNGQNGTPDLRDKFVMGTGTYGIGSYIAPGLPNIWGTLAAVREAGKGTPSPVAEGAFVEQSRYNAGPRQGESDDWGTHYNFNAARCSDIYGRSATVQPPAISLRYIMKL